MGKFFKKNGILVIFIGLMVLLVLRVIGVI
jgi:hypothetical protein